MKERTVSATEFKAKCLALLDQVAEKQVTYVVTKRGRTVAKLVPVNEGMELKSLKGSVIFLTDNEQDLFSTGEAWDMNDPNLP